MSDESDKTLNMLINVLLIGGVLVLIFNYGYADILVKDQISSQVDYSDNNSSVVKKYGSNITKLTNLSSEIINISLATEDDKRLIYLMIDGDVTLLGDIVKASNAAENKDYSSLEKSGIVIKKDSQKYLDGINGLNISSPFENVLYQYRQALENYYTAGRYIEISSKEPMSKYIEKSIDHIDNANIYMNNAYYLINVNRSESKQFLLSLNVSDRNTINITT